MVNMAYSSEATAVFNQWKLNEDLCHRACRMCLAQIGKKKLVDRQEVAKNYGLLSPVV